MTSKPMEVRIHVMMAHTRPHRRPHMRFQLESRSVMLRRPTLNNSSVTLVLMTESQLPKLKIVKQLTQPKALGFLGRYSHLSCWGRATIKRASGPRVCPSFARLYTVYYHLQILPRLMAPF